MDRAVRYQMLDWQSKLSIRHQCRLLHLNRSMLYYQSAGESAENLALMKLIDGLHMRFPYYGVDRICAKLGKQGYAYNVKRIRRLMRLMGIEIVYPKPNTSKAGKGHKIYPYLLRHLKINRVNQVWCADITYIPVEGGFFYLVAIMDWFSRYVLSWRLSNSLTADFCVAALQEALSIYGLPEIFNTDQGSQFTGDEFTGCLLRHHILISMDGKGRCFDNIMIERLWRSLKYEEVYLHAYKDGLEAMRGISGWMKDYNTENPHKSLNYQTPEEVYLKGVK